LLSSIGDIDEEVATLPAKVCLDPHWKRLPQQFNTLKGKEAVHNVDMLIDGAKLTKQEAEVALAFLVN